MSNYQSICVPLRRTMNKRVKSFHRPSPHHSLELTSPPASFLEISKTEELEHSQKLEPIEW